MSSIEALEKVREKIAARRVSRWISQDFDAGIVSALDIINSAIAAERLADSGNAKPEQGDYERGYAEGYMDGRHNFMPEVASVPIPPIAEERAEPEVDNYVAWLRWDGATFETCDSDAEGAFRVYRRTESNSPESPDNSKPEPGDVVAVCESCGQHLGLNDIEPYGYGYCHAVPNGDPETDEMWPEPCGPVYIWRAAEVRAKIEGEK